MAQAIPTKRAPIHTAPRAPAIRTRRQRSSMGSRSSANRRSALGIVPNARVCERGRFCNRRFASRSRYAPRVLHELWVYAEGQTFCLAGAHGDDARALMPTDAQLVWAVEANSHIEAMMALIRASRHGASEREVNARQRDAHAPREWRGTRPRPLTGRPASTIGCGACRA